MRIPITSAADIAPWRSRLAWTQARAADELRIHVGSIKRIEGGRAEASGTLLRLAELLELHHGAMSASPEPIAAPTLVAAPVEAARNLPAHPRSVLGTPFGRPRRPAPTLVPAPAILALAELPTPTPAAPEPSEADLMLDEAFDRCSVSVAGRPLVLAEIERQRLPRYGSRVEGGPTDREIAEEAEDREDAWRAASGGRHPLVGVARLVAEMAGLGRS